MADESAPVEVTVRYFAAAQTAAGLESEIVPVTAGNTVADLTAILAKRSTKMATVLDRCCYLRNGFAVQDDTAVLSAGDTVDVLPPFAGG
ncbi:MoaD/ThiS family protein [Mycobacterium sp.]|uniref:MoaD/ThiS family protein n=1 Tax=Mycobacterium sp. TaxID=1785 RepID=UPI003A8A0F9A